MKFSVLMSVYNKEKSEYLKESLDSILEQTYKPNEIVLVKDGELNEELEKVILEYKKNNKDLIKTISLAKQEKLGGALKIGVNYCSNEYIARMDTDDVSLKDRFEKQIKYLEKNFEIDLLGGYIEEYDESLIKMIDVKKVPLKLNEIKEKIKRENPFNHRNSYF